MWSNGLTHMHSALIEIHVERTQQEKVPTGTKLLCQAAEGHWKYLRDFIVFNAVADHVQQWEN